MKLSNDIQPAVQAAIPIVLGYIAIGIPCGILEDSIGLSAVQVFFLSCMFYSGAGQFMIPNMWLAGSPIASIVASVSLVNTRQMLYSASFAPMCANERRGLSFLFSATVTDESFGVNMANFATGTWNVRRATVVNLCSCTSWTLSNVAGVLIGSALGIPLAIASFAMTSIFICLLVTQKVTFENAVAAFVAMVGVFTCKAVGLAGPAILVGAVLGVVAAMLVSQVRRGRAAEAAALDAQVESTQAGEGAKTATDAQVRPGRAADGPCGTTFAAGAGSPAFGSPHAASLAGAQANSPEGGEGR